MNKSTPKSSDENLGGQAPEILKLQEELAQCQKQADEYLTGWKRAKADFVNRERDIERQRTDFIVFAADALLRGLLPTYEAFVKACAEMPPDIADTPWGKGVAQVQKSFDDFFKKEGVVRMEVVGKKFDPMAHEVVAKRKEEGKKSDVIVEEVRVGYTLHGKPFITPKVIIAE